MTRKKQSVLRRTGVMLAAITTAVVTAGAGPATAAPAAAADRSGLTGDCPFVNTLCLFDDYNYGGARFNVRALDPSVGACVDLAAHGWGGGRVKSAINTNPAYATLRVNGDCTGYGFSISGSVPSFTLFEADGVFVY